MNLILITQVEPSGLNYSLKGVSQGVISIISLYLDEPVYNNSSYRRKSVFAEAYNPEDDEGDETKVSVNIIGYLLFTKIISGCSSKNR